MLLILPKPNTHTSGEAENMNNKSFLGFAAAVKRHTATQIFQGGKIAVVVYDRFTIAADVPRRARFNLRGLKGLRTDCRKRRQDWWSPLGWNLSISDDPVSTHICKNIGAPFVERHNFDEESAKCRKTWVGGTAGSRKQETLLCKPDGFLWIKMSKWWKNRGCSESAWGRE